VTEALDGAERTDPTSEADASDEAPLPVTVAAVGEAAVLRLADPAAAGWEGALAAANRRRADAARDRLARRLDPLDVVLDIDPTGRHDEPVPITLMDRWADPDTIWAIVDRSSFRDTMPKSLFDTQGALELPVALLAPVIAMPLLLTAFSPRRWRATEEPQPTGYAAYTPPIYTPPEYSPSGSAAPSYSSPDPVRTTWSPPTQTTFSLPTQRPETVDPSDPDDTVGR